MARKDVLEKPPIFTVVTNGEHQKTPRVSGKRYCLLNFIEFCKRTDLHGYKYIVMKDLSPIERSCWCIAVVVSIIFACFFVVTAYRWYARNPIITVIESTHGAIWDVPFPAVTICDLNVVSKKQAKLFSQSAVCGLPPVVHYATLGFLVVSPETTPRVLLLFVYVLSILPPNMTSEELFNIIRLAPLVLNTINVAEENKFQLHLLQHVLDINNMDVESFFRTMSSFTSCKELVTRCMWKNTIYECNLLFRQVFTQFGVCCTFNYYAIDDGTHGLGNYSEFYVPSAPRRVASCGYQTALTVLLDPDLGDYYSASIASYGVLVIVDNAYNLPDINSPLRMVSPSSEVFIALSPERTYSTPGIRAFSPEERRCYFKDEAKLGRFEDYSYHNCMVYQKVKTVIKHCDCVPLYFPKDDNERYCDFHDIDCLEEARHNVDTDHDLATLDVECLPDCEHFDYPLEVALGILATDADLSGLDFYRDTNLTDRSLLNIFFNDLVTTRYRRDVYLNWQNLLASFGGLLSLMLGFTLISAFDLVIFFTFRFWFSMTRSISRRHNTEDWLKANNKVKALEITGNQYLWLNDKQTPRVASK